jgi:hypothetical protein
MIMSNHYFASMYINIQVDMAFAKKRVEDRKQWLLKLEAGVHINYDVERINYNDFINRELILFSHADIVRSLPHFMDGLKPSQRKVLFACFKRNLKNEIKVAQLAGQSGRVYSEHSFAILTPFFMCVGYGASLFAFMFHGRFLILTNRLHLGAQRVPPRRGLAHPDGHRHGAELRR